MKLPIFAFPIVQGYLIRRNILTYKAPDGNEGYDLICIHPDARYKPKTNEQSQIRIQVKSRYQTDCDRGFPIKEKSLDAFDFLIIAFMNIGKFYGTSYHVNPRGEIIDEASEDNDELLISTLDLDMIDDVRKVWQFYRDRFALQY